MQNFIDKGKYMDKPLISYVITAYNSEKFISEAIDCAFNQTYSPLEIIVSDDCSTDNTWRIIEEKVKAYNGTHKVKISRNEKNMGISQHMSKAYIELAQGEIIVAAHADDISLPERVEKSYQFLNSHPDCNAVSFAINYMNEEGEVVKGCQDFTDCDERYYGIGDGLKMGNIPAPSRAFYKEVMTTFGWLDKSCPTEDELITFRAQLMGKKNAYLKDELVFYRKHENSSSSILNFDKFPLSKIYKQLEVDANKAVMLKMISQQLCEKLLKHIRKQHKIRKCYREWLVSPSIITVLKIQFRFIPLKSKLYFFKLWLNSVLRSSNEQDNG